METKITVNLEVVMKMLNSTDAEELFKMYALNYISCGRGYMDFKTDISRLARYLGPNSFCEEFPQYRLDYQLEFLKEIICKNYLDKFGITMQESAFIL